MQQILKTKTEDIQEPELGLAKEIIDKLRLAHLPYVPAAGLAATQIGVSKSVFIFSYDRDPKNMEGVIKPAFKPMGKTKVEGWGGVFR